MHRLDERILITPALLQRFSDEATLENGNGAYMGFIQRSNGVVVAAEHPASAMIDPNQTLFARDVLTSLNRDLNHGGAWVIVYTHPVYSMALEVPEYQRFGLMWMDADGDIQFTVEWERGTGQERDFAEVMMSGIHSWLNRCETAWQTWNLHMREVLAPSPDQLVKAAQGQTRH